MSFPKSWNKTLNDLFNEDRAISEEEMEWARAYERDVLLKGARFPLDGEKYIYLTPVTYRVTIHVDDSDIQTQRIKKAI